MVVRKGGGGGGGSTLGLFKQHLYARELLLA